MKPEIGKLVRVDEQNRVQYAVFNPCNLPLHVDSETLTFREPQQHVIGPIWDAIQHKKNAAICIPCGCGKSVLVNCVMHAILRKFKIIAVPTIGIANSFLEIRDKVFSNGFSIRADKIRMIEGDGIGKTDFLINLIKTDTGDDSNVYIISHALLVNLFKRIENGELDKTQLQKCVIGIDESHHVGVSDEDYDAGLEGNQLGKMIVMLNQLNVQHIFTTATLFRNDGKSIIPKAFKDNYHVESLAMADLRSPMFKEAHIPDLKISLVRYSTNSAHELLEAEIESEKDPDRVILPGKMSLKLLIKAYLKEHLRKKGKTIMQCPFACIGSGMTNAEIAVYMQEYISKRHPGIRILNLGGYRDSNGDCHLVSSNDKLKRIRYASLKKDSGIHHDIVISIAVMNEGLDWPPCSRIFLPRMTTNSKQFIQRDAGRILRLFENKNISEIVYFLSCLSESEQVDDEAVSYFHKIMTNYLLLLCNETVYDSRPFEERMPGVSVNSWISDKKEIFSDYLEAKNNAVQSGQEWKMEDATLFFSSHPKLEGNKNKINSILRQAFRLDSMTMKQILKSCSEKAGSKDFHLFYAAFGEQLKEMNIVNCALDQCGDLSVMVFGSAEKVREQLKKYRSGEPREFLPWPKMREIIDDTGGISIKKVKTENPQLRRSDRKGILKAWVDGKIKGYPKCPKGVPYDIDKVYGAECRMDQIKREMKKKADSEKC